MLKTLLIFLTGLHVGVFAAPVCVDGHNYSLNISQIKGKGSAAELLAADLSKYLVSFCHPFYGYSYKKVEDFHLSPEQPRITEDPSVQDMYSEWNRRYIVPEEPIKEFGENVDGLYFAVDPIVSREFGKEHWLMYRAELPASMKALNIAYLMYQSNDIRFIPPSIQEKMKAEGCNEYKYDHLYRKNRGKACREIAMKVLKILDVDAIQYSWRSADFTSCRGRQRFAYIVIRPEIIKSTAIFSYQNIAADLLEESRALKALYRTAQKNQSPFTLDTSTAGDQTVSQIVNDPAWQLWPNSDSVTPLSDTETDEWVKAHLLGCQR